ALITRNGVPTTAASAPTPWLTLFAISSPREGTRLGAMSPSCHVPALPPRGLPGSDETIGAERPEAQHGQHRRQDAARGQARRDERRGGMARVEIRDSLREKSCAAGTATTTAAAASLRMPPDRATSLHGDVADDVRAGGEEA